MAAHAACRASWGPPRCGASSGASSGTGRHPRAPKYPHPKREAPPRRLTNGVPHAPRGPRTIARPGRAIEAPTIEGERTGGDELARTSPASPSRAPSSRAEARAAIARKKVVVDYLVVGSGISGLSYALEAAEHGRVAIVTKDVAYEGSTHYAQGGISAVMSPDDTPADHARDTHVAGDFLCDSRAVDVVCAEGKDAVDRLIEFGAEFTRCENTGELHLAREGGHSKKRIVHAADMTGKEIERALLETAKAHPNVSFYEHHVARDLIVVERPEEDRSEVPEDPKSTWVRDEGKGKKGKEKRSGKTSRRVCVGAAITRRVDGAKIDFYAHCVLLASGGAGQLFPSTTNPGVSTGDGVAMAVRAAADVTNMEFYQFHPTSLYTGPGGAPKKAPNENAFLITEAVRGHGGRLFNHAGERFMPRYDQRGELAPRDVVARAIDVEIKRASLVPGAPACVFLDVTHVDAGETLTHFPGVAAELKSRGIDLTKDRVPVTPAAHYLCGGVCVDLDGRSSVEGLYACGETAHTGLHGANRLASNSLLEAVVFAKRAAADSARRVENEKKRESLGLSRSSLLFLAAERAGEAARASAECPDSDPTGRAFDAEAAWASAMRRDLQRVMWASAGIVRDSAGLESAEREVEALLRRCEVETARRGAGLAAIELRNLITVGLVVLRCAGRRKESRGLHYNADFPERVERERKPTKLKTNDLMTNDLMAR